MKIRWLDGPPAMSFVLLHVAARRAGFQIAQLRR